MADLRRIAAENRTIIVALVAAALLNLLVLVLGVYPLRSRVAAAENRAQAAVQAMRAAQVQDRQARAMVKGKQQAGEDLQRFYREVLPDSLASARRVTYLRLAQLARESNLQYQRRSFEEEPVSDESPLTRLDLTMVLQGEYDDIRQFIHQLETSTDFVVIRDVSLARRETGDGGLTLTLELSTFYRHGDGS